MGSFMMLLVFGGIKSKSALKNHQGVVSYHRKSIPKIEKTSTCSTTCHLPEYADLIVRYFSGVVDLKWKLALPVNSHEKHDLPTSRGAVLADRCRWSDIFSPINGRKYMLDRNLDFLLALRLDLPLLWKHPTLQNRWFFWHQKWHPNLSES